VARLEDLRKGSLVRGVIPDQVVTIIDATVVGDAVDLTYRDAAGQTASQLLLRSREPELELVEAEVSWSFDADPELFKLVTEALRIRSAYLFDPHLAVTTSLVEPLPHQITAVYAEMLARQPLRFLLADDPGAGKTIMAGLLMKELIARGDLRRCLVCCPGGLADQWQDEMWEKFRLDFRQISRDTIENSRSGNPYRELDLVISRLDHMARNDEILEKLKTTEWDLIVSDEAHKMSATVFGTDVKYTKRYRLGQLLSGITRHFLLMTATPHNGKEEDFQLFMALIDPDRFEGRYRVDVHDTDASDLMRRMVKEDLLKFDGTPLFPERRAYSVKYELSPEEAELYRAVTDYVREEFNRAERLESDGRKGTVGFALTILQRRLASSPEAIWQSLRRRRERLEKRMEAARQAKALGEDLLGWQPGLRELSGEDLEDLDEAPDQEVEEFEDTVIDQATAARTIAELQAEIQTLGGLEALAYRVRNSGTDKKWEELSRLLQDNPVMFDAGGHRRKLIVFSEHRDTLRYLRQRVQTVLGRPEAVVTIDGGMSREARRLAQEQFTQDKRVLILIATDAAGEGINLQRAHLMVNYDLPWNPNRLEQRFGRIHRIGQTEVCHLWNLVAANTREGEVYDRLLTKLEAERQALGGRDRVFDVLGEVFRGNELRQLLIEAIRYGEQPEVKERLYKKVDTALDHERLRQLIEEQLLASDVLDASRIQQIREEMERAEARKLQPHYIGSFFREAFQLLGGSVHEREADRYEITHVPSPIRARQAGVGGHILQRYERITFKKELIHLQDRPDAEYVCPGHPLLEATTDLLLDLHRDILCRGAVLVDPNDQSDHIRVLSLAEHTIELASDSSRPVSRRMQFVELADDGSAQSGGPAPHLNYEPATEGTLERLVDRLEWIGPEVEQRVRDYAIQALVPGHIEEVQRRREELTERTMAAVNERLTKEIVYWDSRAEQLKAQEQAGKQPKMNWQRARERAMELQDRLQARMAELERDRHLAPRSPVALGAAVVIPGRLVASGELPPGDDRRAEIEKLAMDAVMATERGLGFEPRDVARENLGYDVESRDPDSGRLRFIEVKGRVAEATTVSVTRNEITTALNSTDRFILAIVLVSDTTAETPRYVREPFRREPDFGVTSVNYKLSELLERATEPR